MPPGAIAFLPAAVLFALAVYWLRRAEWVHGLGFSPGEVTLVFTVKTGWCLLFALLHYVALGGGDTLDFFNAGAQVHRALYRGVVDYLALVFLPNNWYITEGLFHYDRAIDMYGKESSFFLVRLNALFALVSFGSYPAHLVLFSVVTLPGLLCWLRFCYDQTLLDKNWVNALMLLFPGVAFWCNGMHKEALALSGLGCGMYGVQRMREGLTIKSIGWVGIGLVHFIARWSMVLFALPLAVAVFFNKRKVSHREMVVVSGVVLATALVGWLVHLHYDLVKWLSGKQAAFAQLTDDDKIQFSLAQLPFALVIALYRTFLAPLPFVGSFSISDVVYFLSNAAVLLLPIVTFKWFDLNRCKQIGVWFMAVAILNFIAIGMLVPQAGALQRYKAPMLAVLIIGWLMSLRRK